MIIYYTNLKVGLSSTYRCKAIHFYIAMGSQLSVAYFYLGALMLVDN